MRIQDRKKRLGNLRKIIIQLQVDAGRKERKAFDDALRMRVLATICFEKKTGSDFRILFRKFGSHMPEVCQFPLVVRQDFIAPYPNWHEPLLTPKRCSHNLLRWAGPPKASLQSQNGQSGLHR